MTDEPRDPSGPGRAARSGLLALALFAAAFFSLHRTRERHFDTSLESDEPQWIAVSILHWRQLTANDPPEGYDPEGLDAGVSNPWKQGFQRASFGARNPCLPKWVLGGVLGAAGHREASHLVFPRLATHDPVGAARAAEALKPAMPLARVVMLCATAMCAVLLFFAGWSVGGWLAGALAYASWLASPLVQRWATYVRTDFFMVAFSLATLVAALSLRDRLAGRRGVRGQVLAATVLGLLSGAVISSKLNGGLILAAVSIWIPLLWLRARAEHGISFLRGPLLSVAAAFVACFAFVWALNPVLWSSPIDEGREIFEFWREHMAFQQERGERAGFEAVRTTSEKLALVWKNTFQRDEPLRAVTGVPGGVLLIGLGGAALLAMSLRREGSSRRHSESAMVVAVYAVVISLGNVLWLPLDWDRYFFPLISCWILFESGLVAAVRAVRNQVCRRTPPSPPLQK